jgi:hypothetical protein
VQLNDLFQLVISVYVQFVFPAKQVQGSDHAHQAEIVVAVQVGYEDMTDLLQADMLPSQLHLCSFCTIEEQELSMHIDKLGTGISMGQRYGSTTAQYGYGESHPAR